MTQTEIDARHAKAAATAAAKVQAVRALLHLDRVAKVEVTPKAGIQHIVWHPTARIVLLPKGRTNPYREDTDRWQRYEILRQCHTVADFVAALPAHHYVIAHAVLDGYITVK